MEPNNLPQVASAVMVPTSPPKDLQTRFADLSQAPQPLKKICKAIAEDSQGVTLMRLVQARQNDETRDIARMLIGQEIVKIDLALNIPSDARMTAQQVAEAADIILAEFGDLPLACLPDFRRQVLAEALGPLYGRLDVTVLCRMMRTYLTDYRTKLIHARQEAERTRRDREERERNERLANGGGMTLTEWLAQATPEQRASYEHVAKIAQLPGATPQEAPRPKAIPYTGDREAQALAIIEGPWLAAVAASGDDQALNDILGQLDKFEPDSEPVIAKLVQKVIRAVDYRRTELQSLLP